MIERRPGLTVFAHAVLIGGVLLVALPIWLAFVASTEPTENVLKGADSGLARRSVVGANYATVLGQGVAGSSSGSRSTSARRAASSPASSARRR